MISLLQDLCSEECALIYIVSVVTVVVAATIQWHAFKRRAMMHSHTVKVRMLRNFCVPYNVFTVRC